MAGVWAQDPLYRAETATAAEAPQLRVMQANIFLGQADTASVVHTVRDRDVDILTVSELTVDAAQRLQSDGVDQELPYSFLRPRAGGGGTGIYSRYPLSDGAALPGYVGAGIVATYPANRWYPAVLAIDRILTRGGTPISFPGLTFRVRITMALSARCGSTAVWMLSRCANR